jgi:dinuclear metal center YbgI/SA1388 family protein
MVIWKAVKEGVSIYCAHTNVDRCEGGLNDVIAEKLGLSRIRPLGQGMVRMGRLGSPVSAEALLKKIEEVFPNTGVRSAGKVPDSVRELAVCCGSGAGYVEEAKSEGARVLITGDVKYHDARRAEALGVWLVDVGHFALEREFVPWMTSLLAEQGEDCGWGIVAIPLLEERDPFERSGPEGRP